MFKVASMSQSIVKSCAFLSIVLLLLCAFGPVCLTTGATKDALASPQPMVSSPAGNGPYTVGYIDDTILFSTKAYNTVVRIYYPANTSGVNTGVNRSKAPYPCIDWFPGTGGDHTSYGSYLTQMASWGFLVAAWDISVSDWPHNGNTSDLNEFLDHLELRNATPGDKLSGMIDKNAFGLAGHSAGGGLTFADGSQVARIKVAVTFSAAMSDGVVDGYGPGWSNKKILMQVGSQDTSYKEPSEYAKYKLTGIHNFVEIWGGDHQCWQNVPYLFHAFFLYWLDGQTAYFQYIYGPDTVNDFFANIYDLVFWYNTTYFFPPKVDSITADPTTADMDSRVDFDANISGYDLKGNSQCSYQWDFNDDGIFEYSSKDSPAANYTFTSPQIFTVNFQYALGTALNVVPSAPLTINVKNVVPVAVAGPDIAVTEDTSVDFDGSGSHDTPSDNATLQFMWTFGDSGKTDYSNSPLASHTYTKPGLFKAVLSVKDVNTGVGTATIKVNVTNVPPVASAGKDITVNEDQSLTLSGTGTDTASDTAGLQFKWDLGDGNSTGWSSAKDCPAIYPQAGNYTATFHVKDIHGAETTSSIVVHVNNVAPLAIIQSPVDGDSNVEDDAVSFSGSGTDTQSDTTLGLLYLWDFGDGTSSGWAKVPTASHAYTKSGEVTIKFTVKDDDGATDFQLVTMTITNPAPVVKIDNEMKKAPIEDETVMLHGSATDTVSDLAKLGYLWDLGDGTNITGPYANHSYPQAKTYTVTLTVTDDEGAKGTASVQITVSNVKPSASVTANRTTVKVKEAVSFSSNGSTDTKSDLATLTFSWNFGDGTTSTDPNPTHTYTTAGTRTVTLTVTDNDGVAATQTVAITVQAAGGGGGGGDDHHGNGGVSSLLIALLVALVVVIVVVLVLVMFMRKKKKATMSDIPPKAAEKYPDAPTTVPEKPKVEPPAPSVTEKKVETPKEGQPKTEQERKAP